MVLPTMGLKDHRYYSEVKKHWFQQSLITSKWNCKWCLYVDNYLDFSELIASFIINNLKRKMYNIHWTICFNHVIFCPFLLTNGSISMLFIQRLVLCRLRNCQIWVDSSAFTHDRFIKNVVITCDSETTAVRKIKYLLNNTCTFDLH